MKSLAIMSVLAESQHSDQDLLPPSNKKVKWDVEDPSEFRPTLKNLGKEKESFRAFYEVRVLCEDLY